MTPLLNELLGYAITIIVIGFKAIFLMVALLLGVAYLTFVERKVIGYMQLRDRKSVV